eukprot:CAMPEP_0119545482 /NCGR_PEP_ID=MMETSP1352-20130426/224_1 /TAXON_ID=265584 /ORGANISM="Stauroneis constricta, Strain CCMP1120" /LENGTH=371 /DNA_ID=CAMNT_0007590031 /DNA_START=278 /DNA_END=1393 /DNA_ORIENTATION=-
MPKRQRRKQHMMLPLASPASLRLSTNERMAYRNYDQRRNSVKAVSPPHPPAAASPSSPPPSRSPRRASKRQRFLWSQELNQDFSTAIFHIGMQKSKPKQLYERLRPICPSITMQQVTTLLHRYEHHHQGKFEISQAPTAAAGHADVAKGSAKPQLQSSTMVLPCQPQKNDLAHTQVRQPQPQPRRPQSSISSSSSSSTSTAMQSVCQYLPESQLEAMMRTLNEATSSSNEYLLDSTAAATATASKQVAETIKSLPQPSKQSTSPYAPSSNRNNNNKQQNTIIPKNDTNRIIMIPTITTAEDTIPCQAFNHLLGIYESLYQELQSKRQHCTTLSKGRRNLVQSNKLCHAMNTQQIFRNQLHALKRHEINKNV